MVRLQRVKISFPNKEFAYNTLNNNSVIDTISLYEKTPIHYIYIYQEIPIQKRKNLRRTLKIKTSKKTSSYHLYKIFIKYLHN